MAMMQMERPKCKEKESTSSRHEYYSSARQELQNCGKVQDDATLSRRLTALQAEQIEREAAPVHRQQSKFVVLTHAQEKLKVVEQPVWTAEEVEMAPELIRTALAPLLGGVVLSKANYEAKLESDEINGMGAVDLSTLFGLTCAYGVLDKQKVKRRTVCGISTSCFPSRPEDLHIYVKNLSGKEFALSVSSRDTIADMKLTICQLQGISTDVQRLIFAGTELSDDREIRDYDIESGDVIHLVLLVKHGSRPCAFYIDDSLFDPQYNQDFTSARRDPNKRSYRGGFEYQRPFGYYRFALKVKGKYESDDWLGPNGCRSHQVDGEWPVSYHGTSHRNGHSIAKDGFDLGRGKRFLFGRGIYSTPAVEVASVYAPSFELNGHKYKMILQNRVKPDSLQLIRNETTQCAGGDYFVSPKAEDVRPYGICLKKIW